MTTLLTDPTVELKQEMIRLIRFQLEEAQLVDIGWYDIWCVNDEAHHEVSNGPKESLEDFAARMISQGWAVESLERGTAICRECANAPDTSHWASQYEDERGLLG